MRRVLLLLGLAVLLLAVPAGAQASVPCSQGTKVIPAQQCAFWNMAEYMNRAYGPVVFRSAYINQTVRGRYHTVWGAYLYFPGPLYKVTVTAKRCGNTYVSYDNRKRSWWPRYC